MPTNANHLNHPAADVNIYSSNPAATVALHGNHENSEIGQFLANYLEVDVDAITHDLVNKAREDKASGVIESWMGRVPDVGERLDGDAHMAHYHGDFKH
jgi:alkaline phosphatase